MTDRAYMPKAKSQEWGTPDWLFRRLHAEFNFTIDVAASDTLHKLPRYWTTNDDALRQTWTGERLFINPPFAAKALHAFLSVAHIWSFLRPQPERSDTVVMIVPLKTDQTWWHDHVLGVAEVRYIRGRISFVGASGSYPGGIAILVYQQGREPIHRSVQNRRPKRGRIGARRQTP